jgi:uncharacterized membrane protein
MGLRRRGVFVVLLLSLLGSYVNVPIATFPAERIVSGQEVTFFGMRYVIPLLEAWPKTVLAVNIGGAVIPTLPSLYLLAKTGKYGRALLLSRQSAPSLAYISGWLGTLIGADLLNL